MSTFLLALDFFLAVGNATNCASRSVFCPKVCQIASTPLVKHFSLIEFSNAESSSLQSPRFNCLLISKTANLKASDSVLSDDIISFSGNQSIEVFGLLLRPLRRIIRLALGALISSSSPGTSASSKARVRILRHFFSIICQSGDLATFALRCCLGMFAWYAISKHFAMCSSCILITSYILPA